MEFERKESLRRFFETTTLIYATARSPEAAEALVEALKEQFFVGTVEAREARSQRDADTLLKMQGYTYKVRPFGEGGVLEIDDDGVRGESDDAEFRDDASRGRSRSR